MIVSLMKAGIPVISSFLGKGSFPETDDWSLGAISRHVRDRLAEVIDATDLWLTVGFDYIEGIHPRLFSGKPILNIDVISARREKLFYPAVEMVGDVYSISENFARELNGSGYKSKWDKSYIKQIQQERYANILNKQNLESFPFNPFKIMQILQKLISGNDIIVSDVGIHKQVIGLGYKVLRPFGAHFSNGLSSMGFSLPFSAGLRFVLPPNRKIVSINGDGGFLMNVQELETIKRYNLDIKIIIFADGAFGMIKSNLLQKYQRVKNLDFTNPDFRYLAKSFGLHYLEVTRKSDLRKALNRLLHSRGATILAIPTKYS